MIVFRKHFVVVADLYWEEQPNGVKADVVRYRESWTPRPGMRQSSCRTIVLDLTKSVTELLEGMEKHTRYKIRRAAKDPFVYEDLGSHPPATTVIQFCDAYGSWAARKGLPPVDRQWLAAMADAGSLSLSRLVWDQAPLVWHAYYRNSEHVLLFYSVMAPKMESSDAAAYQRANRFLYWKDILKFKTEGVSLLDFGGWYDGQEDNALLRINKFKEHFGAKVVEVHNSMQGMTLKGKLAVWYVGLKAKRKAKRKIGGPEVEVRGHLQPANPPGSNGGSDLP